ncbi:DAK2 domain-containing protein [Streptomyces halobius]|uniref:DAK2 domain-containing protein n=1 Tax=Streptomyces halobius TaxID=2879846 RepID=A0ABY4M3E0_9ACTN|nr:DAK2 domain-containing protein [Streptomyces halobius]UQA92274.1 DAK2 domain-containing protein [Streptomyces halobius]
MDVSLARHWVQNIASAMSRNQEHLTTLDSAIGDGDHGANMARGFFAVRAGLDSGTWSAATAEEILVQTGRTLVSVVGGASGPLFGSAFRALGAALDTEDGTEDDTENGTELGTGTDHEAETDTDATRFAAALAAGLEKIQQLGAAVPGDKTMIDAYAPAYRAFHDAAHSGADFRTAAHAAADAAEAGMRATVAMQAGKGRASYLGLRSVGHQDPGATSTAYVFRALADATEAEATGAV